MLRRFFGGSKFLKKMNTLMRVYSTSHNAERTYQELVKLKPLIRLEGEHYFYEAADIMLEIPQFNPEFDAKCAQMKTKIMDAM